MIELVKWTLGFITLMMAYIIMVAATANAAEAPTPVEFQP